MADIYTWGHLYACHPRGSNDLSLAMEPSALCGCVPGDRRPVDEPRKADPRGITSCAAVLAFLQYLLCGLRIGGRKRICHRVHCPCPCAFFHAEKKRGMALTVNRKL